MTRALESATADERCIYLDFGDLRSFHLIRLDSFDVLLDESAWGQEYDLVAAYRPRRRNRSYHDVLAMTGPDGTVYLTLAMSEALRQAQLPRQLAITLGLDVLFCARGRAADSRPCRGMCEQNFPIHTPFIVFLPLHTPHYKTARCIRCDAAGCCYALIARRRSRPWPPPRPW